MSSDLTIKVPNEILKEIFWRLPLIDLQTIKRVCARWQQLFVEMFDTLKKNPTYPMNLYQYHFSQITELNESKFESLSQLVKSGLERFDWKTFVNFDTASKVESSDARAFKVDENFCNIVISYPQLALHHINRATKEVISEINLETPHKIYTRIFTVIFKDKIVGILQGPKENNKQYFDHSVLAAWSLETGKVLWAKEKAQGIFLKGKIYFCNQLDALAFLLLSPARISILRLSTGENISDFYGLSNTEKCTVQPLDRSFLVRGSKANRYFQIGTLSPREKERLVNQSEKSDC